MNNTASQTSRKASQSRGERRSTKSDHTTAIVAPEAAPAEVIKLGVDTHLNSYSVARMIDGGNPQPAQNMTPETFLKFAEKHPR